jgi:4-diphosphocytidyl-2-C-methyl-D-erythritol kinase
MSILTVKAPAKINLHLRVKNRRPDGFHELDGVFAALDFGDILHFEPLSHDGELIIEMNALPYTFEAGQDPQQALPPSKNIIFRAVSLFRERSGFHKGLKIRLEKHIPLGGGLGGGSSDAAATLLALNTLSDTFSAALDDASLAELGLVLGSDVPFFLKKCAAARVCGRGETVQPLNIPPGLWIVLVNPGFSSDTGEAFRLLDRFRAETAADARYVNQKDLTQRRKDAEIDAEFANPSLKALRLCASARGSLDVISDSPPQDWPFTNDFLPVFLMDDRVNTAYQNMLGQLREQGADFAGLSGAGSTCFGVFTDRERARMARENLQLRWNFVKFSFLLEITDRAG